MKELKNCLREIRTNNNLTQEELAVLVGSCRDNISRLERNKFKNPTYQLLYEIAEYFDRPVEAIFWYEEF
ncbi:MAG: helix-turn-helix domain-containing protein [Eubacteriales bacterium]|nr:helix-turn-helix domain-containing protein [Eubacteriales bacterium]